MPVFRFNSEDPNISPQQVENAFYNLADKSNAFDTIAQRIAQIEGANGAHVDVKIVNNIPGGDGALTVRDPSTGHISIMIEKDAFNGDYYKVDPNDPAYPTNQREPMSLERYLAEEVPHALQEATGWTARKQPLADQEVSAQMTANYIMHEAYGEARAYVPPAATILTNPNTYKERAGTATRPQILDDSTHKMTPISAPDTDLDAAPNAFEDVREARVIDYQDGIDGTAYTTMVSGLQAGEPDVDFESGVRVSGVDIGQVFGYCALPPNDAVTVIDPRLAGQYLEADAVSQRMPVLSA